MFYQIFLQIIKLVLGELENTKTFKKYVKHLAPQTVFAFMLGFVSMIMLISFYNSCVAK